MINKISIKNIILCIIVSAGLSVMALSFLAASMFQTVSHDRQDSSVKRLLQTIIDAEFLELEKKSAELGEFALKERETKKFLKIFFKEKSPEIEEKISNLLDQQFNQKFVTTGIVDLYQIRLYDKNFNLVLSSKKVDLGLPTKMPKELYEQAHKREGAERLKRIGALWSRNSQPLYSTLIPLGGLRLIGYTEIISNPVYELESLSDTVGLPIRIMDNDSTELLKTGNWDSETTRDIVAIFHKHNSVFDKPQFTIEALEDISDLNSEIDRIQVNILATFAILICLGAIIILWGLRRALFLPVSRMVDALQEVSKGNLAITVSSSGFKEISMIATALEALVKHLRSDVDGVITSANQMASEVTELEKAASDTEAYTKSQNNKLSSIGRSVESLVASAQDVALNAADASKAANNVGTQAKEGRHLIDETVTGIKHLSRNMTESADVVKRLGQDSENIGAVVDVIRGIAEQTNLLALNAAIEAARAGEDGRGFAVVADEVRSLASRTQHSTTEIQAMVEGLQSGARSAISAMQQSQEHTARGVEKSSKLDEYLNQVVSVALSTEDMIRKIADSTAEQKHASEEINQNVTKIGNDAERALKVFQRISTSRRAIADESDHLRRLVQRFNVG